MKITLEVPDTTVTGFVNIVFGEYPTLHVASLTLNSEAIENRFASFKSYEWGLKMEEENA